MHVSGNMRPKFGRLIVLAAAVGLAGTAVAQWRHFGEDVASPETAGAGAPAAILPHVKTPASMVREIIDAHNVVRSRVGTAPLTWSDRLASVAQGNSPTAITRTTAKTYMKSQVRPPHLIR